MLPLKDFENGSLWIQSDEVREGDEVCKVLPNGKEITGQNIAMSTGVPVSFSPRVWHEVQPWKGERLVLLLFTPRATKLTAEGIESLKEVGFNVDPNALLDNEEKLEENELQVKTIRMKRGPGDQEVLAFEEVDEEEFMEPSQPFSTSLTTTTDFYVRKAEVQYTKGIEDILSDLKTSGKPLEVTHNVSLNEVKRNLAAWKSSALKEYHNLKDVKKAFSVRRRSELPPNCRIVPCKGVYTVKPDKSSEGFRRKTRFVACGNHVPEEETTFDLFAAGVDATSLRSLLAVNARKPWRIGTTDVRQAFVLAKWLGQPVALEPPSIAYELELASPGELWYVEQAIYGLRESPALWSRFRDEQLELARWTTEIAGEEKKMRLQQLVSDNQIWRITSEEEGSETYGYIVVYIDDLLIFSEEEAMHGFFGWVSAKWEVDALDILDFGHPIRFLGMEIHRPRRSGTFPRGLYQRDPAVLQAPGNEVSVAGTSRYLAFERRGRKSPHRL